MSGHIAQPTLPYQATGTSFVLSRRIYNIATVNETPISLFKSTTKTICWNVRNTFCWGATQSIILSAYADPTISAIGVAQTPINLRIGSPTKSTVTASNDPTATAYGNYLASLKASATQSTSDLLIVIDPGHSLLITASVSVASTDIGVGFSWYEVDL